jgi:hypothetical protein
MNQSLGIMVILILLNNTMQIGEYFIWKCWNLWKNITLKSDYSLWKEELTGVDGVVTSAERIDWFGSDDPYTCGGTGYHPSENFDKPGGGRIAANRNFPMRTYSNIPPHYGMAVINKQSIKKKWTFFLKFYPLRYFFKCSFTGLKAQTKEASF